MYQVVKLTTSLRRDEVDQIDHITERMGSQRFRRAGTLRAMLRYALDHEDELVRHTQDQDGKPIEGGEGD